jgi:hypothetical protein
MIMCKLLKSPDNGVGVFQMKMAGVYEEVVRSDSSEVNSACEAGAG